MNILIVDDDFICKTMMQKICEQLGTCESAESGEAALTLFKSALEAGNPFDVITLDKGLPDQDGIEVLRAIRQEEKRRAIPRDQQAKVIMVTGTAEQEEIDRCAEAGCDNYIIKPFRRQAVTKMLERYR